MRPQSELGKVRKRREKDPQLRSRRRREYRRDRKCNTAGTMNTPFASSMLREAVDCRRERNSRPDRDGRKFDSEADIDDTRRQAVTDSNRSGRKSANSAPCCREPTIAATCPSHVCGVNFLRLSMDAVFCHRPNRKRRLAPSVLRTRSAADCSMEDDSPWHDDDAYAQPDAGAAPLGAPTRIAEQEWNNLEQRYADVSRGSNSIG